MNDEWETQDDLFEALAKEFDFVIDLAASEVNRKIPDCFMTLEDNCLEREWASWSAEGGYCWLNPPFSRGNIDAFMAKVACEVQQGLKIVTLTKLDTTDWFKRYVWGVAREIRILDKRLRFKGAKNSYPWPCCVSIYDQKIVRKTQVKMWGWG